MAEGEGTPEAGSEAPVTPGTPGAADEVTTLRSRNAGLDAKVTSLTKSEGLAKAEAAAAAQKLADYEAGKIGDSEALKAQLQTAKDETAAAVRDAKLARIEAKFPETFALFGEGVETFSEDKLAASEARLKGVAAEEEAETPTPRGTNPSRGANPPAGGKEQTSDDILASLKTMGVPPEWRAGGQATVTS